jgi:hypothetical protein
VEAAPAPAAPGPSAAPAAPEIAHAEPAATTGYDETAGIVYEVAPARGFAALGIDAEPGPEDEAAGHPGPALGSRPARPAPALGPAPAQGPAPTQGPGDTGKARAGEEPDKGGGPLRRLFPRGTGPVAGDQAPPPLTRVRDLPFDQRLRLWRSRALVVIVVGVVFSVIVDWEVGVTLAIVAGIADTIYRARSVEAQHVPQAGTIDRASWRAQRRTRKQLTRMERAGYLAIHRRPIPDSEEVIDHLVVGPTGVYAIDSEKWAKDMPIRARNGKTLFHGPDSKKDRLEHARWEASQAGEQLSAALGREIKVRAALAIYGPKIPWDIAIIRDVDVFSGDRLRKYLNSRARKKSVKRLSPAEIQEIRETAAAVLPLDARKTSAPVG